ncbi:MAG: tetratricopeptide repeat protein [Calditrichaeota bacterium]|nr:tetratricopeptide repeat protein [Calditrichota bacterium]
MTTEMWYLVIFAAIVVILLLIYSLWRMKSSAAKKRPVIDPYVQGLNALVEGDLDRAADYFRTSAQKDSENIDAYLKLGDIFRKQGYPDRATKIHRELLVRRNLNPSVQLQILRSLVQDYRESKRYDQALKRLDEILQHIPKDEWALSYKVELFEEMGEWDKAFRTLNVLAKSKRMSEDVSQKLALYRVEEARQLFSQGHEKSGRIKLREALKIDKKCVPAYLYLGDSYMRENRADDALKTWKNFVEEVPEYSHLVFSRLRELLFRMGKFSEIESILTDLLHKHPENYNVYYALIHLYENKGQYLEAINLCDQILEGKPDDTDANLLKIRLLARLKDFHKLETEVISFTEKIMHPKEEYVCSSCGYRSGEPLWHCPKCGGWNTFDLKRKN